MNERIREFYERAQEIVFHSPSTGRTTKQLNVEKFAELIVRECIMLVEGFKSTQEVALDEYIDYEASVVLKEHFGV